MGEATDAGGREKRYDIVVRLFWCAALLLVAACRREGAPERALGSQSAAPMVMAAKAPPTSATNDEAARCTAAIGRVLAMPAQAGAPELEARRAETFARAKADPVLFVRAPAPSGGSREGQERRRLLFAAPDPV